jgi:hypothetical protein
MGTESTTFRVVSSRVASAARRCRHGRSWNKTDDLGLYSFLWNTQAQSFVQRSGISCSVQERLVEVDSDLSGDKVVESDTEAADQSAHASGRNHRYQPML